MALMIDIKTAIPLILMLGLVMNVIVVCRLARHVQARKGTTPRRINLRISISLPNKPKPDIGRMHRVLFFRASDPYSGFDNRMADGPVRRQRPFPLKVWDILP